MKTETRSISASQQNAKQDITIPLLKEYLAFLSLGFLACLCVALFTYRPLDTTSWSPHLGVSGIPDPNIHNAFGKIGAQTASLAYTLFGAMAPVMAVLIFLQTSWFFLQKQPFYTRIFILKFFGYPQFFLCSMALFACVHPTMPWFSVPWSSGGLVGLRVAHGLRLVVGQFGGSLLLGIGVVASLTLVCGFGPVSTVSWLLKMCRVKMD